MEESVATALEELSSYRAEHFEIGGDIYALDVLAIAALNRSIQLHTEVTTSRTGLHIFAGNCRTQHCSASC